MAASAVSLAQFLVAPETDPPREYVAGAVVVRPELAERERWLRADLSTLLYGWARVTRGGAVASELRCTFGGGSYVPDVIYIAQVPAGVAPNGTLRALEAAPDFVCEICPASVDPAWFAARLAHYVSSGVRLAWLVDPAEETVTVYQPAAAPVLVESGGMLDGGSVLPGFYLYIDDLFEVLHEEA